MVNKTVLCVGCNTFLAAVGIALLVLSSLVVHFVDEQIKDAVTKKIQVKPNFEGWKTDDINDYMNPTTNYTYYAWNITNLDAVRFQGARPKLQQCGPWSVTEFDHLYNVSWSPDGTVINYNQWWTKYWKSDADAQAAVDKIYSLNPAYFGVITLIKNRSATASAKESTLLASLAPTVLAGVSSNFLTSLKGFSLPIYFQGAVASLTGSGAFSSASQVVVAWGTSNASYAASDPRLACFDLFSTSSTLIPVGEAAAIWNAASNYSLLSIPGISLWTGALTGSTATANRATLASAGGYSASTITAVLTWLGARLGGNAGCSSAYETLTANTVTAGGQCAGATTFEDLRACQIGSSGVTRTLNAGNTADPNSSPTSSLCSLMAALGVPCKGPEFSAYAATQCFGGPFELTIAEANGMLTDFTSAGGVPVCSGTPSFVGLNGFLYLAQANPAAIPSNYPALASYLGTGNFTNKLTCLVSYISTYLPTVYGFAPMIMLKNGGLFTYRTPAEIMLGYPSTNPDPLLTLLSSPSSPLSYDGILTNYSSLEQHYTKTQQRRYRMYTGVDDVNKAGKYQAYRGCPSLQSNSDRFQTSSCLCTTWDNCAGVCTGVQCPPIWTEPEIIDGSCESHEVPPFQEGLPPVSQYRIFAAEPQRAVNFSYLAESEVKGIKTRRFVLDSKHFLNQTDYPWNARYRQNQLRGLVWMSDWFNLPVFLTRPQFAFEGDPMLLNQFENGTWPALDAYPYEPLLSYIDVEPLSGLTMRGHKRLQYTLQVSNDMFNNPLYSKVFTTASTYPGVTAKTFYWPAFWADEWGIITDDDADSFRSGVYGSRDIAERLMIAGYCVGAFLVLVGVFATFYIARKAQAPLEGASQLKSAADLSSSP